MGEGSDRARPPDRGPDRDEEPGRPAPEEGDEDLLADIADEVERRRRQGEGRDGDEAHGSEGAAGKIESGEW